MALAVFRVGSFLLFFVSCCFQRTSRVPTSVDTISAMITTLILFNSLLLRDGTSVAAMAVSGFCVVTTDTDIPIVTKTTMEAHTLHALDVFAQHLELTRQSPFEIDLMKPSRLVGESRQKRSDRTIS